MSVDKATGTLRWHNMSYGVNHAAIILNGSAPTQFAELRPSIFEEFSEPEILSETIVADGKRVVSTLSYTLFHVPYTVEVAVTVQDGIHLGRLGHDFLVRYKREPVSLAQITPANGTHANILAVLSASSGVCDVNSTAFFDQCPIVRSVLQNRQAAQCEGYRQAINGGQSQQNMFEDPYEHIIATLFNIVTVQGFLPDNCPKPVALAPVTQ